MFRAVALSLLLAPSAALAAPKVKIQIDPLALGQTGSIGMSVSMDLEMSGAIPGMGEMKMPFKLSITRGADFTIRSLEDGKPRLVEVRFGVVDQSLEMLGETMAEPSPLAGQQVLFDLATDPPAVTALDGSPLPEEIAAAAGELDTLGPMFDWPTDGSSKKLEVGQDFKTGSMAGFMDAGEGDEVTISATVAGKGSWGKIKTAVIDVTLAGDAELGGPGAMSMAMSGPIHIDRKRGLPVAFALSGNVSMEAEVAPGQALTGDGVISVQWSADLD